MIPEDAIGNCFVFGQIGIYFDGEKIYLRLLLHNKKARPCKSKLK